MSIYCFGSQDSATEIAYLMKYESAPGGKADKWSRPISTVLVNSSSHKIWETTRGDGTVPWLSSTHMCSDQEIFGVRGWKGNPHLNPGQVQVARPSIGATCISFCDDTSQTEVVELKPAVKEQETSWLTWIHKEYVLWAHRYVSHVIAARPRRCGVLTPS